MDETTTKKRKARTPQGGRPRRETKPGELVEITRSEIGPLRFGVDGIDPGENAKFLTHAMQIRSMPEIDITDPVVVEERINDYFKLCLTNDIKPSASGLRMAIGVAKSTISVWRNGKTRKGTHQHVIVQAYNLLEALWEDYMQNGKINPASGIFLGVNNYGYQDVRQVNVTPVVQDDQTAVDVATIEAKYAELPDSDD